ncbi:MAG TPA: CoA ester lyase [Bacillales bacterium]|nr:CoA ester lyase [Bacillales bacterium]
MKPARSYLFVPAKKRKMMEKAVSTAADCVIFDLEDAVAYSEKEEARSLVQELLPVLADRKPIFVRMNDVSTPYWREDVASSVKGGAQGIVVPKAERKDGVQQVCDFIREVAENDAQANCEVIPLVESAKGVQFCYDIASADPLVSRIAFGSIDFSFDVGCELSEGGEELLFARSSIVIASRAAEIGPPIDAVYPNLQNNEGLRDETNAAKRLGFKGKLIIHPKQLDTVHEVFSPGVNELREAEQIVQAFEDAERKGLASISVNGRLVDYPVYKKAKERLDS